MHSITVMDKKRLGELLRGEPFIKDRQGRFARQYKTLFDIVGVDEHMSLFAFSDIRQTCSTASDLESAGLYITSDTVCVVCELDDDKVKPHDFFFWEEFVNSLRGECIHTFDELHELLVDQITDYRKGDCQRLEQVVFDHRFADKVDIQECTSIDTYLDIAKQYGILTETEEEDNE